MSKRFPDRKIPIAADRDQSLSQPTLLESFLAPNFSPQESHARALELLEPMVASLLFHSQLGSKAGGKSSDSKRLIGEFLLWLESPDNHGDLPELAGVFGHDKQHELLLISRYLQRFMAKNLSNFEPVLLSNSPEIVDLTSDERQISNALSAQFMDTLWASVQNLDTQLRLPYQLYLEGLYPEEISQLLDEPLSDILEKISSCKFLLGQGLASPEVA